MACASASMSDILQQEEEAGIGQPLIRQYCAHKLEPGKKLPLQDLSQSMAMGVVQMVVGITNFGLGVTLAATSPPSLAIILRVPILTGLLFFICGLLSSLLKRFSRLLNICFVINIGCLSVAGIAIVLLILDISLEKTNMHEKTGQVTVLILCVTVLTAFFSAFLVYWLHREMRSIRKNPDFPAFPGKIVNDDQD